MIIEKINPTPISYIEPSPELEELQNLMPIDPDDYKKLKEDISKNKIIRDALKCYQNEDGKFLLLAGFNRLKIAKELNIDVVPVQVYKGSTQEYRELVINDNLNRRHLSGKQKGIIAAEFFKINPESSANEVAKKAGISDKTAGKIKKNLQRRSEIPDVPIIDTKGRKQPAKKPENKPDKKPVKTLAAADTGKTIDPNYGQAYSRLLKAIEKFIKKNPKIDGIKTLKQDIEDIKNIVGEN